MIYHIHFSYIYIYIYLYIYILSECGLIQSHEKGCSDLEFSGYVIVYTSYRDSRAIGQGLLGAWYSRIYVSF